MEHNADVAETSNIFATAQRVDESKQRIDILQGQLDDEKNAIIPLMQKLATMIANMYAPTDRQEDRHANIFAEEMVKNDDLIKRLQVLLKTVKARRFALYKRLQEINNQNVHLDKRKMFNPEKNLKISAQRSYDWSKARGRNADEARTRATAAALSLAKSTYPEMLVDGELPDVILDYIKHSYENYDHNEAEQEMEAAG